MQTHSDDDIKSSVRVFGVLEALNQSDVTSVDRLHKATGLPKPTPIRVLKILTGLGYVFHVSRRDGYALTEKVLRLSAGFRYCDATVDVARPLLEAFTARHKWQISIATPDGAFMRVRFNTRHISPFAPDQMFLNRRIGMLNSAMGLAYIAFCQPSEREVILDLARAGDHAVAAGVGDLDAWLEGVRSRGYATVIREPGDRVRSFAAPVLAADGFGVAIASLAMFYFVSSMSEAQAPSRYLEEVHTVSRAIAEGLAESHLFEVPA